MRCNKTKCTLQTGSKVNTHGRLKCDDKYYCDACFKDIHTSTLEVDKISYFLYDNRKNNDELDDIIRRIFILAKMP